MGGDGEASSSSLSEGMYDAFLSFRGDDTRYLFTDHLYHRLAEIKKLKVFRDEPNLKMGDQVDSSLMEAIKRSRMFIVVMSENYVSSRWCLMELEEMLKYSNNGKKRPIFPIFYHVEPAEVRHQISEKSKKAMADHEKRVGVEKVKEWKLALSTLCGLSGQHIVVNKGYETQVMGKIAEKVLAKHREIKQLLNKFDSEFDEVESLLKLESRDDTLGMVAIYEEDAKIDTTTFAFELYYKIKYEFKAASFLLDVSRKLREDANGLEDLRKELLSDIGVEMNTMMGSTSSGSSKTIKQMLQHKRVLLVLDGVETQQHLELLAGRGAWFGPGSRIIITTEVKDLLHNHPVRDGVVITTHCIGEGVGGSFADVEEENVVGLEEDLEEVIKQLKGEEGSPGNVVSIVGMPGSGKTTLARKVYNSIEARQLFPYRAWVTISQRPILIQVLKNLLKCLRVPCAIYHASSNEEELKERLRKRLNGKKYLVVLDDVWDTNTWAALRGCFSTYNDGSMILATTRDDRVANVLESKKPHVMVSFMNDEESWQLFRNEVFHSTMCPPELEAIGRSIAESCNGLPLLIKTTAGIVAKKERSEEAWKEIKKLLPYWSIAEDKSGKMMMEILKFSYDDLSEQMKPCFLYLGVFPEDEEIFVRDLICMWIAEDFIKPIIQTGRSKIEPEDIGEQYLKELVDRNLVQVVERRSDGKGVKTCKIHDVIRELCISMSNNPDNKSNKACSLLFPEDIGSYACLITPRDQSSTCSLFLSGDVSWLPLLIPQDCQVINVLYLERREYRGGVLTYAEYLNKFKSIRFFKGKCDGLYGLLKVQGLQTLIAEYPFPRQRKKISIDERSKQLRHFVSTSRMHLLVDAAGVKDKMQNMQTLLNVHGDSHMWFLFNNGYFANLRTLGLVIIGYYEVQLAEKNLRSLDRLSKLRKLDLDFGPYTAIKVPLGAFPSNLTSITLRGFGDLKQEHMNTLGRIPGLQILKLLRVLCSGEILHCGSAGSFPQLQVFILDDVLVSHVILEDGAMPKLRRAVFDECQGLKFNCLPKRMLCLGSNLHFVEYYSYDGYFLYDD